MQIKLSIPDYDGNALDVIWEENSNYSLSVEENGVVLRANKQGLISLAKQMIYMAYNNLPTGSHVHYDSFFTKLNNEGVELVIEKDNG